MNDRGDKLSTRRSFPSPTKAAKLVGQELRLAADQLEHDSSREKRRISAMQRKRPARPLEREKDRADGGRP